MLHCTSAQEFNHRHSVQSQIAIPQPLQLPAKQVLCQHASEVALSRLNQGAPPLHCRAGTSLSVLAVNVLAKLLMRVVVKVEPHATCSSQVITRHTHNHICTCLYWRLISSLQGYMHNARLDC
jgi:hypothetical protein